jgi:hypothetical protein
MNRRTPVFDERAVAISDAAKSRENDQISPLIAFFIHFRSSQAVRGMFAVAVLAAGVGAPVTASAAMPIRTAAYDGVWNVLFATEAGTASLSP